MSIIALRRLQAEDWPSVHAWGKLPQVCRYQTWGPNSPAQSREFTETAADAWNADPQHRFAFAAASGDEVIGMGELLHRGGEQGEIQYIVHPRAWGRGIGTQIGEQLLDIGFRQHRLHRIFATCDPRNLASAGVIRKIGMTAEGRLRHTVRLSDGWRDSLIFSILDSEWNHSPDLRPSP